MTATESAPRTVPEPSQDHDGDAELRAELTVARASAAARAGELDAALRELDRYDDDPAVTRHRDVTDLRARVHAQRGELAAAEQCWRQLLDEHPEDESAAAGLARVRRFRRRGPAAALGRARHRGRPAGAILLCAAAVAAAAWAVVTLLPSDAKESTPPGPPAAADAEEDIRRELTEQQERAAAEAAAEAEARRTEALEALAEAVRIPGARVVRHEDSVEVVFEQGLFYEATELTDDGAAQLARVGEALAGQENVRVEVLGHIADVPGAPTSGGSDTSLWRATEAARALSEASGRPLTGFLVAAAEQRDAPHDTDAANRTVTVILTPNI